MLAFRLVHDVNLFRKYSFCPKCNKNILWYDNIPILSWIFLKGKCRACKNSISFLYLFIELISLIIFSLLFYKFSLPYLISYFLFFSALIITIRTDIETMLISRYVTLFLIPTAFMLCLFNLLPISITQSIAGCIFAYFLLTIVSKTFTFFTKKNGMGQGDIDLLAFIGSFTGIYGAWITLLIGSILGSIFGIGLLLLNKLNRSKKIPFGPFLASAAILYVLYQEQLMFLIFPN